MQGLYHQQYVAKAACLRMPDAFGWAFHILRLKLQGLQGSVAETRTICFFSSTCTQRAQYPLSKEWTLNRNVKAPIT